MTRTRSAAKRQKIAVVESALANIDVVSHFAAFLEANDLCQVQATCKALGSANDDAAFNGLSLVEEAARRSYEVLSDEKKAMLPRYDGESWIELYHHLLMLRARLTFDQLVGSGVEYRGDKAVIEGKFFIYRQGRTFKYRANTSQAICGNHIMRAGKHWATFTSSAAGYIIGRIVGVVRPLPGWDKKGLDSFDPAWMDFRHSLRQERTDRWEGSVHYCRLDMKQGLYYWSDWQEREGPGRSGYPDWEGFDDYDKDCQTLGMLLDLCSGTLSVYQNGRRLGALKDGLAGEYCWVAGVSGEGDMSIQRGYNVNAV